MTERWLLALLLLVTAAVARGEAAWPGGIAFVDLGLRNKLGVPQCSL